MRVGVLDLLTTPARGWSERAYHTVLTKQYAAIMPQAIAVWSRRPPNEMRPPTTPSGSGRRRAQLVSPHAGGGSRWPQLLTASRRSIYVNASARNAWN